MWLKNDWGEHFDLKSVSRISHYKHEYKKGRVEMAAGTDAGSLFSLRPLPVAEKLLAEITRIVIFEGGGPDGQVFDVPARAAEIEGGARAA